MTVLVLCVYFLHYVVQIGLISYETDKNFMENSINMFREHEKMSFFSVALCFFDKIEPKEVKHTLSRQLLWNFLLKYITFPNNIINISSRAVVLKVRSFLALAR